MAKSKSRGEESSWKNPGLYHYSMTAGMGMALITIQILQQPHHYAQPSLYPPTGDPAEGLSPSEMDFQIYVGGIQYHIISGDVKTATKLLNAARRSYGNTADLAALTCHLENQKDRPKACLKACQASLTLPFKVDDSNWQMAALNRVSIVFSEHNEIEGAVNAARRTLEVPGAMSEISFVFRLIQLLGKRAACVDLVEAQKVLTEANGKIEPDHMMVLQHTLPWLREMHSTFCSFSHLAPEVMELLHHPDRVLSAGSLPPSAKENEKDTAKTPAPPITVSPILMSASPDFGKSQDLSFLFSGKSSTLRAATQFLGGDGSTSASIRH